MLDESLIGKKENRHPLKCESCGLLFDYGQDEKNWKHIDDEGICLECE